MKFNAVASKIELVLCKEGETAFKSDFVMEKMHKQAMQFNWH